MVLVKKWSFFQTFFFRQDSPGKCLLRYSRTKMAIFPNFFFRQYRPGKCLLQYSRTKKRLSRLKKKDVEKLKKLTFFQRG